MAIRRKYLVLLMLTTVVFSFSIIAVFGNVGSDETMESDKHVVLLGASVGKAWDLADYPTRMSESGRTFENVTLYQYDKSEGLDEILIRPERKFKLTRTYLKGFFLPPPKLPDILMIKECAAYFPGDLDRYRSLIMQWVKEVRAKNIEFVLATTVPVTRERAGKKPGQAEQIKDFNKWLRSYAETEGIRLFDLEAILRESSDSIFLREEFSNGDGLHLNQSAYALLDQALHSFLQQHN